MNVGGARQAWIGVGSNLQGTWGASPDLQVAAAMQAIDRLPGTRALAQSSLYRSPPMGPSDQPDYANAVMRIQTRLAPATLLRLLKRLERHAGRDPHGVRWGPRALDLDLLHVEGWASTDPALQLPHPGIAQRAFVLRPWAEIDPALQVPGAGTVAECAARVAPVGIALWSATP